MEPGFSMERFGKLPGMDRSFDIAYWQRLGPKAIFEAARPMVVDAERQKGRTGEFRLQRSVEQFRRGPSSPAGQSLRFTLHLLRTLCCECLGGHSSG